MFDDLIKRKPYKEKVRYYICIGCDNVYRKGIVCPTCGKLGEEKEDVSTVENKNT